MAKRNLLICFDAFGTLFAPKRPIAQQYGEVARACGLSGFSDEDVAARFKEAFKNEAKQNPNYGRATGMGAEKWWTNIINNTFLPYAGSDQRLPPTLAPKLLHRFNSSEGYTLFPDVLPLLRRLRNLDSHERVVIGIITNSDDRVPDVLHSLGVLVNPLRYGDDSLTQSLRGDAFNVDFTVLSYDVGYEKPDRRIFDAAVAMLGKVHASEEQITGINAKVTAEGWQKIYAGDEFDKDVLGAVDAGWHAVLVDRENLGSRKDVDWVEDEKPGSLFERLAAAKPVGFGSLAKFAEWFPYH